MLHSIGIIAAKKKGVLVKLTGMLVTTGAPTARSNIVLESNGTCTKGTAAATGPLIAGEWYTPGATSAIGSSYRARYVTEAGALTLGRSGAFYGGESVWGGLDSGGSVSLNAGTGRFRIEIQDVATSTLQASAQFWTSGYAP